MKNKLTILLLSLIINISAISALSPEEYMKTGFNALDNNDYKTAYNNFEQASLLGNTDAMVMFGFMFLDGLGTTADIEMGLFWLQKSANGSNSSAQRFLGMCYKKGMYVDKDLKEAARFFELAANAGDARAYYELAYFYAEGEVFIQNFDQALYLLEESAKRKYATAMYELGLSYQEESPRIRNIDNIQAYKWHTLAVYYSKSDKDTLENARKEQENLIQVMTSDEISKALSLARKWVDEYGD